METFGKKVEEFNNNYPNSVDKRQYKIYLRLINGN